VSDYNPSSFNDSKPPALRFCSQQDAFDFADRCIEDGNRILEAGDVNFIEAYNEHRAHLVIRFRSEFSARERDLVFCAVPFETKPGQWFRITPVAHNDGGASDAYRSKRGVGGIAKLIQIPNGAITSLVWAEPTKERQDFGGQILAPFSGNNVLEAGQIIANGKVGILRSHLAVGNGRGVADLIENGAKGEKCLKSKVITCCRNAPRKLDLVRLVNSIGVRLDNNSVWTTVDKPRKASFEICDVFLCAGKPAFGAIKMIGTGQRYGSRKIKSNQKKGISARARQSD
jgi:hypothetical protein